jgi:hypothetical protein
MVPTGSRQIACQDVQPLRKLVGSAGIEAVHSYNFANLTSFGHPVIELDDSFQGGGNFELAPRSHERFRTALEQIDDARQCGRQVNLPSLLFEKASMKARADLSEYLPGERTGSLL